MVINILKIIGGLWLSLYALAKPFDSEEADEANGFRNPLPFVRYILFAVEVLPCIKSSVEEIDYEKGAPLLFSGRNSEHEMHADEFKNFMKQHNIKDTSTD